MIDVIGLIVQILISLCIIIEVIAVPLAIVLAIIGLNTENTLSKKKFYKIAIYSVLSPLVFLILILILWGLVHFSLALR